MLIVDTIDRDPVDVNCVNGLSNCDMLKDVEIAIARRPPAARRSLLRRRPAVRCA
jgi:hypothetical protein